MTKTGVVVRSGTRADVSEMATMLARAFHDDPPMMWMLPDEKSRPRRLRRMFATILRYEALQHECVDVAEQDGRIVGVAVWMPLDMWKPGRIAVQLVSAPGFLRAFGRRIGAASNLMVASIKAHPPEPHWYLSIIGVDPAAQGTGAASCLLRSRLAKVDALGVPSFLESSKLANVPVYEHFGYAVTGVVAVPEGAPVLTAMWRDAAAQG